jgi:hypothetical protein
MHVPPRAELCRTKHAHPNGNQAKHMPQIHTCCASPGAKSTPDYNWHSDSNCPFARHCLGTTTKKNPPMNCPIPIPPIHPLSTNYQCKQPIMHAWPLLCSALATEPTATVSASQQETHSADADLAKTTKCAADHSAPSVALCHTHSLCSHSPSPVQCCHVRA